MTIEESLRGATSVDNHGIKQRAPWVCPIHFMHIIICLDLCSKLVGLRSSLKLGLQQPCPKA